MSFLFIFLSYLIGSINFAYIVASLKNLDISSSGSGNPGTSNVMRILGKKYAAFVLLGDVLKGIIPILLLFGWSLGFYQRRVTRRRLNKLRGFKNKDILHEG